MVVAAAAALLLLMAVLVDLVGLAVEARDM
jgi:hypothetical protein